MRKRAKKKIETLLNKKRLLACKETLTLAERQELGKLDMRIHKRLNKKRKAPVVLTAAQLAKQKALAEEIFKGILEWGYLER